MTEPTVTDVTDADAATGGYDLSARGTGDVTAGRPALAVRLLLAASAMAVILSFQLTTGVDALVGELTLPGSAPGAMTDITSLGANPQEDWVAARETWEVWALLDCPQTLFDQRCPGRATARGVDLAQTFLKVDIALMLSLFTFAVALHLAGRASTPGTSAVMRWLASGVKTKVFLAAAAVALVAEVIEGLLAWYAVNRVDCEQVTCTWRGDDRVLVVLDGATFLKLAAYALVGLYVLARLAAVVTSRLNRHAMRASLGYLALVAVVPLVFRVEQSQDVIRGLSGAQLAVAVGATVWLALVVGVALVRALQPKGASRPVHGSRWQNLVWALPAAALLLGAWGTGSRGLAVGAALLGAIAVVSCAVEGFLLPASVVRRTSDTSLEQRRFALGAVLAIVIAALPAVGIGALTPEALYVAHGSIGRAMGQGGAQLIGLAVVGVACAVGLTLVLDRLATAGGSEQTTGSRPRALFFAIAVLAPAIAFADPDVGQSWSTGAGGATLVLVFAASLAGLVGLLRETSLLLAPLASTAANAFFFFFFCAARCR